MSIEQITESEAEMLIEYIDKEKKSLPQRFFLFLGLFMLINFMPGRNGRPSTFQEYGFWKPLVIEILAIGTLFYFDYKTKLKGLQNDLESREKIIEEKTVLKKDRSFLKSEYQVWIETSVKEFKKFDVTENEFNKIEKGHKVILEYGEKSKFLFKFNSNCS